MGGQQSGGKRKHRSVGNCDPIIFASILIFLLLAIPVSFVELFVTEALPRTAAQCEAEPFHRVPLRPESEVEFQCLSIASESVHRSNFYLEQERIFRSKAGVPIVKKIKLTVITRAGKRFVFSKSEALE
jgi:hypothetical protein